MCGISPHFSHRRLTAHENRRVALCEDRRHVRTGNPLDQEREKKEEMKRKRIRIKMCIEENEEETGEKCVVEIQGR